MFNIFQIQVLNYKFLNILVFSTPEYYCFFFNGNAF